jgi:integrase
LVKSQLTTGTKDGKNPAQPSGLQRKYFTDRFLKSLKPAAPGMRYECWDTTPGFGIRVSDVAGPDGRAAKVVFVLYARFGGRPATRRNIGRYGQSSLEQARAKANAWREQINKGIDPAVAEREQRQAEIVKQENTFGVVCEEFFKRHLSKTRQGRNAEQVIRRLFESWWTRPVTSITRRDVLKVTDALVDAGKPYQAHNVLGYARRIFNWAISRGTYDLEHSPCDRMRPKEVIGARKPRIRVLNDDELRALWKASEGMGYPFGCLFQMLALTGQRKSEVAEARWSEIDLTKKLWLIPAARMKSDAGHAVPLAPDVVELLQSLPRFSKGDFLFTSSYGIRAATGFTKAKRKLDARMLAELKTLPPFVIHDIRRTMRTGLSSLPGVSDLVRELVIAHTRPGMHRVYDQFAYLDEKRHALELWSQRLRNIVTPSPANVIEIAKGRR